MYKKMFVLMCVVVMVASSATLATIDDPVGWWKLDEGSGTTTADATANGNDGTLVGDPLPGWIAGAPLGADPGGNAIATTNGGSDEDDSMVRVPHAAVITPTAAITVSAWVKVQSGASQWAWNTAVKKRTGGTEVYDPELDEMVPVPATGWRLQYIDDAYPMMYAHLECENGSAGVWFGTAETPSINDGKWHHVAFTYDSAEGKIRSYTDGVASAIENSYDGALLASDSDLFIGSGRKPWDGIDDVRIFDRALSPEEIAAMVPEPATMLILGLGGLLISRRRRA